LDWVGFGWIERIDGEKCLTTHSVIIGFIHCGKVNFQEQWSLFHYKLQMMPMKLREKLKRKKKEEEKEEEKEKEKKRDSQPPKNFNFYNFFPSFLSSRSSSSLIQGFEHRGIHYCNSLVHLLCVCFYFSSEMVQFALISRVKDGLPLCASMDTGKVSFIQLSHFK
jgi:hypothetical protein